MFTNFLLFCFIFESCSISLKFSFMLNLIVFCTHWTHIIQSNNCEFNTVDHYSVSDLLPGRVLKFVTADIGSSPASSLATQAIRIMTEMRDNGVVAFIGPDASCLPEALVAAAWNLPMISYVSLVVTDLKNNIFHKDDLKFRNIKIIDCQAEKFPSVSLVKQICIFKHV